MISFCNWISFIYFFNSLIQFCSLLSWPFCFVDVWRLKFWFWNLASLQFLNSINNSFNRDSFNLMVTIFYFWAGSSTRPRLLTSLSTILMWHVFLQASMKRSRSSLTCGKMHWLFMKKSRKTIKKTTLRNWFRQYKSIIDIPHVLKIYP